MDQCPRAPAFQGSRRVCACALQPGRRGLRCSKLRKRRPIGLGADLIGDVAPDPGRRSAWPGIAPASITPAPRASQGLQRLCSNYGRPPPPDCAEFAAWFRTISITIKSHVPRAPAPDAFLTRKADCGNLADFRKCPLLGDQPLFLPGTLERFFRFFTSTLLIGCLRAKLSSQSRGRKLPF